jgi:hypothetical protein
MVKLEEVVDEEFLRPQEGPQDDDDWDTDSGTYLPISNTPRVLTVAIYLAF